MGSICWGFYSETDTDTDTDTCVPHCIGNESVPSCADPNRTCSFDGSGILTLCLSSCDPLVPDTCPPTEGCYLMESVGFVCAPNASGEGGGLYEPCDFSNNCDAGLMCADSDNGGTLCGPDTSYCCLAYCDLDNPACPPTTTCTAFQERGQVPPSYKDVGVCTSKAR